MAKTKSNRRRGGAKQRGNWSNADHDARTAKRIASLNKKRRRQERQQEEEAAAAEGGDGRPHHEEPAKASKPQPHHEPPLHQLRPTKKAAPNRRRRLASHVPAHSYKRSHLAHDRGDQIDTSKLRLATSQLQRKVDALRQRLENWDPVAEEARARRLQQDGGEDKSSVEYRMKIDAQHRSEDRTARQQARDECALLHAAHGVNSSQHRRKANLKKRPRPGPETWKLRGAARPAWEVYDFDTRYVDVHAKAREEANAKARRSRNVVALCRGRFALDGDEDDAQGGNDASNNGTNGGTNIAQQQTPFLPPQPHCREFLSLLTQLGSLHLERKNHASARKSLLEAIELEGSSRPHSVTNARAQLMNMYLSTNRPSAARKLWTTLDADGSAWIRYAAALIEYVSWNLLGEEGSTAATAERLLARAVKGNVYVAYLLGWPETFRKAMEYTHEVAERGMDSRSGSILEAIEYGCGWYSADGDSEDEDEERGMAVWLGTEGSLEWVRSVVLKVLTGNDDDASDDPERLTKADLLGWETKLREEEEQFERERKEREEQQHNGEIGADDDGNGNEEEKEEEPDVVMYAGMFRTAMDWATDAGEFLKEPSFEYVNDAAEGATYNENGSEMAEEDETREEEKGGSNDDGGESAEDSDSDECDGDLSGQS